MPTYDYKCSSCEYEFEEFHSMSAQPLVTCPECGLDSLEKLIGSGSAVIVRGTSNPCFDQAEALEKKKAKRDKLEKEKKQAKELEKKHPPWWRSRKDKKIDTSVLKNPRKYIETGEKE